LRHENVSNHVASHTDRRQRFSAVRGASAAAGIKRTDLQRHDLSAPGREVIQAVVEIAPGVTAPAHKHPGEEIIYVLEGSLEYQVEGKPPVTLKAGDGLFIPGRDDPFGEERGRALRKPAL
jgi:quercetin dioxygenase-like cupin family protein